VPLVVHGFSLASLDSSTTLPRIFLLYHFSVHALTEKLSEKLQRSIRKTQALRAGDRVAVAVSGGADSVALLLLLMEMRPEFGIVLSIAHVNHKLRARESEDDAEFVAGLAEKYSLELHLQNAPIERMSKKNQPDVGVIPGIEAAARDLRYAFFRELARCGKVSRVVTAHTLDDQAETVLLRIFRGTGIRGLAGIHPRIVFEEQGKSYGAVIRPLLSVRRQALQQFLREKGQAWREDSSNADLRFDRNRLRHKLLPLIAAEFGDAAIEHMSDLAEIARAEEDHWESMHPELCLSDESGPEVRPPDRIAKLAVDSLLALPLAAQRRVLLHWLRVNAPEVSISFRRIEEVLELAQSLSDGGLQLADACNLRRVDNLLLLERGNEKDTEARGYAYTLQIPGTVSIPELGSTIEALEVDTASVAEKVRGQLLNIEQAPKEVTIRNWQPGERYWPANTAAPKKIKELLTDSHAKGIGKKLWPIAESEGSGILWMRGFDVPASWQAPPAAKRAIWIRQVLGS
jgi:tRNA(Ile)-lysidine synthase